MFVLFFFFKQKTAYEMRISDWSSDVCSSDLLGGILDAQIVRHKEIQNGNFYGAFDDGIDGGQSDRKQWGCTNDTAFTFGSITVRNIFGRSDARRVGKV